MSKHLNTNKQFMIGNGMLAFAVIFIVVIFIYMSLRLNSKKEETFEGIYEITLSEGFFNELTEIHLNDSIIFHDVVIKEPMKIEIQQFASQNALLFVDQETNGISIFNLSDKGGSYKFKKDIQSNKVTLLNN